MSEELLVEEAAAVEETATEEAVAEETVIEEENKCNLEESIERAYNNIEIYELSKKKKTNVFQEDDIFEI
jgi:hypothetical protein